MRIRTLENLTRMKDAFPKAVLGILLLAAASFLSRKNLANPFALVAGWAAAGCAFSFLFALTRRAVFSAGSASVLVIFLAVLDRMKSHYYKEKLMTPDLAVALDPGNLGTLLHYPFAGIGIALAILLSAAVLVSLWRRSKPVGPTLRIAAGAGTVACALVLGFSLSRNEAAWLGSLPKGQGVVVNLLMSARGAAVPNPADRYRGDSGPFMEAAARFSATPPAAPGGKKPDVVVMLQESTTDPRIYGFRDGWSLPGLPVFLDRTAGKASGPLRVHTFGGGTWLSEFSVLTGLDPDDFGPAKNSVFYTVVGRVRASLFREFRWNGYETIVLTSFNPSAYHSGEAYRALGAERTVRPQDFGYPASRTENIWSIPTADMIGYVRRLLDEEHERPRFIYVLTMEEHGPYNRKGVLYGEIRRHADSDEKAVSLSAYFEKLAASGNAFLGFHRYVERRERPLVFLRFGDHQPGIRWDLYRIPYPDPSRVTFFSLRDNLSGKVDAALGVTDISFLGGLVAERAGLRLSPFYRANAAMRRLCGGRLADCPKAGILSGYRARIYSELKDFE